jgi:hypothetical protein
MYYKLKRRISVDFSLILNNKSYWEERVCWVSEFSAPLRVANINFDNVGVTEEIVTPDAL